MNKIADIQYITRDHETLSHAQQAKLMYENGIKWVQLRMKDCSHNEILEQAQKAMEYAKAVDGQLIINDSVEITKAVKAHGIHLGLRDASIEEARQELGVEVIIGGTANTFNDIKLQISRGADYVGLGPYRHTTTKKNLSPVIGLEGYKTILSQVYTENIQRPIVGVGGIKTNEINLLKSTGLHGVAVSGALLEKILNNTIIA